MNLDRDWLKYICIPYLECPSNKKGVMFLRCFAYDTLISIQKSSIDSSNILLRLYNRKIDWYSVYSIGLFNYAI
jgi:hypothetical protein